MRASILRRHAVVLTVALTVLPLLAVLRPAPAAGEIPFPDTERVGTPDGPSTAIRVSRMLFEDGGAEAVVLARKDTFPDALGASAVAAAFNGPVLFTASASLDAAARAELDRVLADDGRVYLMGGTEALSDDIRQELEDAGYLTLRFAGITRIETAALAARAVGPGPDGTVIVARSHGNPDIAQGWVDSISCGGWAAETATPILLTNPGEEDLHPATRATLQRLAVERVVICGGLSAVPQRHADQIAELGVVVERRAGRDRIETAVDVARNLWGYGVPDGQTFLLVRGWGTTFGFGLAAAPLSAALDAPLLLVDSREPTGCSTQDPSRITLCYLLTGNEPVAGLVAVGSPTVISDEVFAAAAAAGGLVADTTPPPVPTGVEAVDTPDDDGTNVTVTWDAVEDPEGSPVRYNVYVRPAGGSFQVASGSPTAAPELVVGGLSPGTTYEAVVTSLDERDNESDPSAVVSATPTDEVPATPTSPPNLQNVEPFHIRISWVPAGALDAGGYVLERADAPALLGCDSSLAFYQELVRIEDPDTTTITDDTVEQGEDYCYRYAVFDTGGQQSGFSPPAGPFEARAP